MNRVRSGWTREAAGRGRPMFRRCLFLVVACGLAWRLAAVEIPAGQPAYLVAQPAGGLERQMTEYAARYVSRVLGAPAHVVASLDDVPAGAPALILATGNATAAPDILPPAGSPEAYACETRTIAGHECVIAVGRTAHGFKRAVQRVVLTSEQRQPGLVFPAAHLRESPWIPRREWSMAAWSPSFVRGVFHNPNVDERVNVWQYGPEQMARYVEMFDWLGFNGGQLEETAASYAQFGSVEAEQSRLKTLARALHAVGDNVSLFVWAAQFTGFGWVDNAVTYTPARGQTAFSDPRVRASFERYYDGYAQLAPEVDLLIAHFYDPGPLKNREDIFSYMRLLIEKFRSANPRVQLAVDSWYAGTESEYMEQLAGHGFKDALFLENTMPHTYPPGRREALHATAKARGIALGVWGWHTAEIETDFDPNFHVNAQLLAQLYRQIHDGVAQTWPISYWSEMEAYHLLNVFTEYAAAQLLWNPARDPDKLLEEIAGAMWSPEDAAAVVDALRLIQDVRTGPNWDTYWVFLPTYRLGTADPRDDLRRAERAIRSLEKIQPDASFVPKLPLPFPPQTFIELMLPHLRQVRQFAAFRIKFAELEAAARQGASKEELGRLIADAWNPVREYSNWIGLHGVREAAEQEAMLTKFGQEHGIEIKAPGWMRWRDANRQLEAIMGRQRTSRTPIQFKPDASFLYAGFRWTKEKGRDRLQLLIDNGVVVAAQGELYQLADWEDYAAR